MLTLAILGAMIISAAAWWTSGMMERIRQQSRSRELESKLRYAYGETESLKSRIAGLQAEAQALKESLCAERDSQRTAVSNLAYSFRKTVLFLSAGCLAVGLTVGVGAGWGTASARAAARHSGRLAELELTAQLAGYKSAVMEKQVTQLEQELTTARQALLNERVEKEVARTKLRILLDSLSPGKWFDSYFVDQQKLKKNLENQVEKNSAQADLPVFKSPLLQR